MVGTLVYAFLYACSTILTVSGLLRLGIDFNRLTSVRALSTHWADMP